MNELFNLFLHWNAWPFWVIFIGIPSLGIWLKIRTIRMERAVFQEGIAISATVLDVRIDEGDCIVKYSFTDPESGKTFERSGVLGFQMKNPPSEGETIPVRYLREKPNWSRMDGEIHLASR